MARALTFGWGVLGTVLLLVDAIWRLLPVALAPLRQGPDAVLVGTYVASMAIMAYVEGYRGFQLSFAPKVAARALGAWDALGPAKVVLAPLYCMGLFGGARVEVARTWALVTIIVGFVIAVGQLPHDLRGAVDAGVVVGLSWGTAAILVASAHEWVTLSSRGGVPGTATEETCDLSCSEASPSA